MVSQRGKEHPSPWICRISRLSTRFVGRKMSRIGFGSGKFFLLSVLYAQEGLSQEELSHRVGIDKSNTSRALAKLEADGLIRRQIDPENHKVKKIYLEPKAHTIKKEFIKIQNRWNTLLLDGFSENEKEKLLLNLKKMTHNAEAAFK